MASRLTWCNLFFRLLCALNVFHTIQCRTLLINTTPFTLLPTERSSESLITPTLPPHPPKIVKIDITSNIQYRYAKTVVKAQINNPSVSAAQEVKFNMRLPGTAFISNFTIQIKDEDKIYVAKVSKKEDAEESYNEAISRGQSAGIVDADARDVNQITVRSNLKAASKMEFTLTYEELLKRHISKYEHIIHIHPGQIVEDYQVNLYINESLPITNINVPELKTSENQFTSELEKNKVANITQNVDGDPRKAHIQFIPTIEDQKRVANSSNGIDPLEGMSGQFIVQYDVDRKNQGSDVQVLDGYFVHFFAPDYLKPLPKHVVFVLDTSGSMYGKKLIQLKDAMLTILDDLSDQDYFNILTFSTRVQEWRPNQLRDSNTSYINRTQYPNYPTTTMRYDDTTQDIEDTKPPVLTNQGTHSIRRDALKHVLNLSARGGTNINDALLEALNVVKNVRASETIPANVNPMIIFLTDGEATSGVTNNEQIKKNVREKNRNLEVAIYGLAFGTGADFNLIKAIGTESGAFSRRIYEASDAAIQLEDFYAEISSPLLTDVTFDYVGEAFKNKTNKKIRTFFKGSEYIIAGKLEQVDHGNNEEEEDLEIVILAQGNSSIYRESIRRCEPFPLPRPLPVEYDIEYVVAENNSVSLNNLEPLTIIYIPNRPCIPWPNPPNISHPNLNPPHQKSEAENFIERLWAYLTIENLLDEKYSNLEIEKMNLQGINVTEEEINNRTKSDEFKALGLALQYNFVTKLTSLVVVKPDGNSTNGDEVSNGTIVNPVPVDSIGLRPSVRFGIMPMPRGGFGNPYGPPGPRIMPMPRGGFGNPYPTFIPRYGGGGRGGGTGGGRSGGGRLVPRLLNLPTSGPSQDLGRQDLVTMHQSTTAATTIIRATTTATVSTDCRIKLFAKTYLREPSITIENGVNSTVSDLSDYSFDDQLSSLEVQGPCCWEIFEDVGFMGQRKLFRAGSYESATALGADLAKEASSLRITTC